MILPSMFDAATQLSTQLSASRSLLLPAAAGRRLMGWSALGDGTGAIGRLLLGSSTALGSNLIGSFSLNTNEQSTEWIWPGVDASTGVSIDRQGGTFDIALFYVDVS